MKTNKFASLILVFLFLTGCALGRENIVQKHPKKLNITDQSTIVCFGDSLTYGHGADTIEDSYPMVMQKWVNVPVINAGLNDDTTAGALIRIKKDVLDNNPVIVIIDFGGNDIYNSKPGLTIEQIENNFRQMLNMLDVNKTQIYMIRYYNNWMHFLDPLFSFDRMLGRLAKDYDIEVIYDVWEGVWGNKELKYDFTHPNSKGYKIIALNVFNATKPTLEYNNLLNRVSQ